MDPVSNACHELFENLLAPQGRLLVGFSGGMDSLVLLHAVVRAAERHEALSRVLAVHVDHGLDPASEGWAAGCRAQAEALGVGFASRRLALEPGGNLEARARAGRYRVFESLLGASDLLVLAHHAGDQLESRLLHLFQGRGLYGMPAGRELGAGRLHRPLLMLPRETLAGYARNHGLSWTEDPSNQDQSLDRNYLRHSLLPALSDRFPSLDKRIAQVADTLADNTDALDELGGLSRHPLPLSVLDGLGLPARIALLRRWLTRHAGAGGVSRLALREFLYQLESSNDRLPSLALPTGRLVRYQRALYLAPPAPELEASYPLALPGELELPHGRLRVDVCSNPADNGAQPAAIIVSTPLRVCFAAAGLEIRAGGHQRRVRELMRVAGLPPWQRASLPLLADRDGVAVVPGIAARDAAAGDPDGVAVSVVWTPLESEAR